MISFIAKEKHQHAFSDAHLDSHSEDSVKQEKQSKERQQRNRLSE